MRAAAVQLTSTPDFDRNLEAADRLTREASAQGAELVVLPEKWPVLGTAEQTAAGAGAPDGPGPSWGPRRGPGRRAHDVRDRRRDRARPDHLLRPALPGAVPHPRRARREGAHRAGRLH